MKRNSSLHGNEVLTFFGLYCVCIWIYLTDRVDTYCIVLNVSTRFYFSVYNFTGALCVFDSSAVPSNVMHPSRSSSTPTIPGLQPAIPCA